MAPTAAPSTSAVPSLRGWFHQWAAVASAPAGLALVAAAEPGAPRWAAALYAACLTGMFVASTVYHRVAVGATARLWARRADHAMIFALVAASITPLAVVALPPLVGRVVLAVAWSGAALGIRVKLVHLDHANSVGSWGYHLLGWGLVATFPLLVPALGATGVGLLLVTGALYSVGAVLLVTRPPELVPGVLGHHELWHLAVVVASACHFVLVARLVT